MEYNLRPLNGQFRALTRELGDHHFMNSATFIPCIVIYLF